MEIESRGREQSKITRQDFIVRFGAGAVSGFGIIGALQGPTTRAKRAKQSNILFLMSYQYRGFDYCAEKNDYNEDKGAEVRNTKIHILSGKNE